MLVLALILVVAGLSLLRLCVTLWRHVAAVGGLTPVLPGAQVV